MDLLISSLGIPNDQAGWQTLQTQPMTSFSAFMQDPVLKQQIAYFEANAPKATTAQALLNDPRLQDFVLTAFGLTSQSGMTALMTKVLNSDPTSTTSFAAQMVSSQYTNIAKAFNYGGASTPAQPVVLSSASVMLDGLGGTQAFGSFSGTFGGVTLSNVDLTGDTTASQIAAALQNAFQRNDGNRSDITVTAVGDQLNFSDVQGRGTAAGFTFAPPADASGAHAATDLVTGAATVPSSAQVVLSGLGTGQTFGTFSGTFGGFTLSNVDLSGDTTAAQVSATLQSAFHAAGSTALTVTANGSTLTFTDANAGGTASGFNFASSSTASAGAPINTVAGTAATSSSAAVMLSGLAPGASLQQTFSGTFGGVTLSDVNLAGAGSPQLVAATLQKAFRSADNGATSISVQAVGGTLHFTDAQGRGTASGFSFLTSGAAAEAPTSLVTGSQAVAATGGPAVTNPTFIQQVVQLYTQAQFQTVVGNTSNSLREALYAQQQLPNMTNWYSVIANPPLADVVQTVLGLPSSFGTLNVDQQNQILTSRMNIADFKNPTKLTNFLNQYIAMAQVNGSDAPTTGANGLPTGAAANPAVTMLSAVTGVGGSTSYNTLSPGNIAMLLLSNATGNSSSNNIVNISSGG